MTPKEFLYAFSPNAYFFGSDQIVYDINITGFPCYLENLNEFEPKKNFLIYEKEQELLRQNNNDYSSMLNNLNYTTVDLKNGKIKFFPKEEKENEIIYEKDEQIKVDIDNFLVSLFKNPDNFLGMELNETIYELYKTLDNLSNLIKQHQLYQFFVENDDIKKYSTLV
jgi:paraquat-inducible protein B